MTEVTLFSYITKEEQERMRVCFRMREASFQNTETIMEYSSSMKKIGLILDGQASVYCCDEEGKQYLLDELKKDGVFGEPFLLPEESQHYYVCAKSKTRVLFIDYEHVIKRCENAWQLSQSAGQQPAADDCYACQSAGKPYLCTFTRQHQKENYGISAFYRGGMQK